MKIIKNTALFLALLMTSSQALAEFKFESAPENTKQEETSVELSWEALEGAFGYYIFYWTKSVENWEADSYEFEVEDLIDGNSYKVGWLSENETYYFSIIWMDEEANQTPYSEELVVVFWDGGVNNTDEVTEAPVDETLNEDIAPSDDSMTTESLKLEDVTFTWKNTLFLTFNKTLDSSEWAQRDIKITDLSTATELLIDSIVLNDGKYLDITLVNDLSTSTEYEVTVISVSDSEGNNIEVWVYGTQKVMSPDTFEVPVVEEVVEEEIVVEEPLEAAPIEPKKLPDTWAKEILLILAALLMGALLLNFRSRES